MNYRGKVTIDPNKPMGPNYNGETMWPTTATYDADTDVTRVDFAYHPPAPTE
jgi:hypothetical protein